MGEKCLGDSIQFPSPLCLSFFITMSHPWEWGVGSAQPSGTSIETGKGVGERGGQLVMGTSHFPAAAGGPPPHPLPQTPCPAPTLLALGDALWGSGQFAYILIYKKLSALADSDAWAAF